MSDDAMMTGLATVAVIALIISVMAYYGIR